MKSSSRGRSDYETPVAQHPIDRIVMAELDAASGDQLGAPIWDVIARSAARRVLDAISERRQRGKSLPAGCDELPRSYSAMVELAKARIYRLTH